MAAIGENMMTWFAAALTAIATAQPVPSINYSLPGQTTPAPFTIPATAEILPFQSANILSRPGAAARHFLLAGTPRIPGRGITVTIRCLLDRTNGRVVMCQDPAVPEPYKAAALGLGSLYQFRLTPAQAAAQGALAVTIQDRIAASDVWPAGRLFQFTQRPPGNITFAQVMTGEQSDAYYPRAAQNAGMEARIRLDCQVQPDLGVFCLNPVAAPGGTDTGRLLPDFQLAALQLSGWFRSTPTRTDGGTAAGTIFRTTIVFRLPE
jgi:hypothetical protein